MKKLFVNLLLTLLLSSSLAFSAETNPAPDATGAAAEKTAASQDEEQSSKFISIPFAFGYMIDVAKDATKEKPWWGRLKIGFQHDDNVIMNSKEAPLPPEIPQKDDWRMVANLNAKYMFYKNDRFETAATYSFFQSLHNELKDFDVTQNMVELFGKYTISPLIDIKATYTFHHMLMGEDSFDNAHIIGPTLIVNESETLATHIEYKYRSSDYKDVPAFQYNSERTGENDLVGITQYIIFSTPAMLRINYSGDKDSTREDYLDSSGEKGAIGFSFMPNNTLLMDFSWEYNKREYKGINPYTNKKRKDTSSVVMFTVTQLFNETYGLNMRLYYMQNDSNEEQYDVARFVPSMMLEMRF